MIPSNLLQSIKEQAKKIKKTVVLPDALDVRAQKAARILDDEQISHPILIGAEEEIRSVALSAGINLGGIRIIDPLKSEKLSDFSNIFFNLRKAKG
ncbi:MAG TPA: phosphate acyltransferase, partial [Bacteroidota bacterium]|nr:phosphate acyltransferase [Bacteroidota bacterium]